MDVSHERLLALLAYDENTGVFTRRIAIGRHGCYRAGVIPGGPSKGYWKICIDGFKYFAHRLAWFYVHAEWPTQQIDHIDGNRLNNAIANLRLASNAENSQNERTPRANNKSGYLGVSFDRGKWAAWIKIDGKTKNLGRYLTPEEAHVAYVEAKKKIHPFGTLCNET
jgi:hypothetical protein